MMLEGRIAEDFSRISEKQKDLLHPAYSWVPCSQGKDDSTGKIERSII